MWNIFLSRKKCLRCAKTHNVVKYKPFCPTCYKDIFKSPLEGDKIPATEEDRDNLRTKFEWLDDLPDLWHPGCVCMLCPKEDSEERKFFEKDKFFVKTPDFEPVWYLGKKRPVCFPCLERKTSLS